MAQFIKLRHNNHIMPKRISEDEFRTIAEIVARFPQGAAVDDIAGVLTPSPSRRTLQRRLGLLVERGVISREGKGPATRYLPRKDTDRPSAEDRSRAESREVLPLSSEARAVRELVSAPIAHRKPVGYDRSFLDAYQPNHSFYLPVALREKLATLGRLPEASLHPGTYVRKVLNRLLIDLSWNSSRLEGNTYSLLETERLLELGKSAEGKTVEEAEMILNHKAAIELMVEQAADIGLNPYTIRNLHALLSSNLLPDPGACGRLRSMPVGITGTVFHPLEVPQIIEECFQQLLDTAEAIEDAFEQAFFMMVQIPYLQPFEDVNKRVSRLAANMPLIQRNLCPISFVDVPERDYTRGILGVYELNRVEYLRDVFAWAYERSCARYSGVCQSLGEPDPFRLRYRQLIGKTVGEIVKGIMDKKNAVAHIRMQAANAVSSEDRERFLEVVETELLGLHEGNIARYRLRPSEFSAWQKVWR